VHRDYKPENVLVNGEGQSKLADFGIAVRVGRSGQLAGTPSYMAPEQWTGGPANPQTDIYAATATFFECLTGHPPFRAPGDLSLLRQQHQSAPIPVDDAPEAVRGLLRRGLAKDPANRPRDADVFLRELEAVADSNYGSKWEENGKKTLARRALLLAALFPLALASMSGTAVADSGLGSGFKALSSGIKKALVAGAATVVIVGGCVALNPTNTSNVTAMPSDSPSPVLPSPGPLNSLFDGTLFITAPSTVAVEESFSFFLYTCGPQSGSRCPRAIPPGPNGAPRPLTPQGAVTLGSFIDVALTATDKAIEITTPPQQRPQPLKAMDDVASWHWAVHATKPGAYELVATVSVLDDDMETLLKPTQDYLIVLTVNPTLGYRIGQVWEVVRWIIGVGGLGAMGWLVPWLRKRRSRKDLPVSKNDSEVINTFNAT
jgi:Protein kinase domain